jgi:predicted RND superfamily exporter protein
MIIRFINSLSLFFVVLLFVACGNDAAKTPSNTEVQKNPNAANFTALATEYCTCSTELVALNKKAKYLAAHPEEVKNLDEMSELLLQSEQLSQKQIQCQTSLEQKYQTKIAENADVLAAIKTACPELADFMENAKKTED